MIYPEPSCLPTGFLSPVSDGPVSIEERQNVPKLDMSSPGTGLQSPSVGKGDLSGEGIPSDLGLASLGLPGRRCDLSPSSCQVS